MISKNIKCKFYNFIFYNCNINLNSNHKIVNEIYVIPKTNRKFFDGRKNIEIINGRVFIHTSFN